MFGKKGWNFFSKTAEPVQAPVSPVTEEHFLSTVQASPLQLMVEDEKKVVNDELQNLADIEESLNAAATCVKSQILSGKRKRIKSAQVIGFSLETHKVVEDLKVAQTKEELEKILPKLSRAMDDCGKIKTKADAIKKQLEERRPHTEDKLLEFEAKTIRAVADIDKAVHEIARKISKAREYNHTSLKLKVENKNPENAFSYISSHDHKELVAEFAQPIIGAAKAIADVRQKTSSLLELEKHVGIEEVPATPPLLNEPPKFG